MTNLARLRRSQKQEKRLASKFTGRTRPGSGSKWGAKGDVRTEKFLIEAKRTDTNQYRISSRVWDKIRKEAIRENLREPLYAININGLDLVAVDTKCPYLKDRDRDYTLLGPEVHGGDTYLLTREQWESQEGCGGMKLSAMIVNVATFRLLLMEEKDFFKLLPTVK